MNQSKKNLVIILALALSASVAHAESDRALVGDIKNGEKLFKKASKKKVRVKGDWVNRYSDAQIVKGLSQGRGGFPKVKSDNKLDLYDVVAYIRSNNNDLTDLAGAASHVLVADGVYDEYALERLKEKANLSPSKKEQKRRIFVLFEMTERDPDDAVKLVRPKKTKQRDRLKPKKGVGYVVFMPLKGLRGGGYEVAFAVDRDIKITKAVIRAPDGTMPDDLNRIAARLTGRGGRGEYNKLKAGGGGRAAKELEGTLSDAWLLGMEAVYMYEVEERDHFAFDE